MAIDYLLKPISEERFKASILKLQTLGNRSAKYELESLNKLIEKIHVKNMDSLSGQNRREDHINSF